MPPVSFPGWAVPPKSRMAHYYKASGLGLVALSLCWTTCNPRLLSPAGDAMYCPDCINLLSKEDYDKYIKALTEQNDLEHP